MRSRDKAKPSYEGPGPGAYGLHAPEHTSRYRSGPTYCFGTAGREAVSEAKMPGPGAYSLPNDIGKKGLGYTQTTRRSIGSATGVRSDVPGPGTHPLKSTFGEGPMYSTSPRLDTGFGQKDGVPGPGEYSAQDIATAEGKPRWGFGTQHRMDGAATKNLATPGPGAYVLNSAVGEGPKFSMKSRYKAQRSHAFPGPGSHGGHYSSFHSTATTPRIRSMNNTMTSFNDASGN